MAALGSAFDQIVCTGVLHHLPDPDAGLRALRSVLAPGGAMHLMVYAPYGRTGITMLQELCRRLGIGSGAGDDELRDLLATLQALPPGHPLESLLRTAPDLRDEAALADALLHPQERAYTVPQLFDFLVRGNVVFGRWLKQAPYSPRCGLMAATRHAVRIARLPPGEQAASVELLRGTMVRHSVVAHADAAAAAAHRLDFSGEGWQRYVPIRVPDTIVVEERLPAGAAAVLIEPDPHLSGHLPGRRRSGKARARRDRRCTFRRRDCARCRVGRRRRDVLRAPLRARSGRVRRLGLKQLRRLLQKGCQPRNRIIAAWPARKARGMCQPWRTQVPTERTSGRASETATPADEPNQIIEPPNPTE